MSIRARLFAAFLLVVGAGFFVFVDWVVDDFRPRYLATMEESMVDIATVLAASLEDRIEDGEIRVDGLRRAFAEANRREFAAEIYELTKTRINTRVYVTDRNGIVLFDSDDGRDEGVDYSRWNDVARTLRGMYGARATRIDPQDPMTSIMHVAAPIRRNGEIVGVVTVAKPTESIAEFLETARRKIANATVFAVASLAVLGVVVAVWVTWPIERLARYVKALGEGRRVPPPRLGRTELGALEARFEEMRTALEGKQYVERYVEALTHQMKGPLSAVRGAAELLSEDMPPEERARFLAHLRSESDRLQDIIDRMLQLAELENRKTLQDVESVPLRDLVSDIIAGLQPAASTRQVRLTLNPGPRVIARCERFLVSQALSNLVQNALDFTGPGGAVVVSVERAENGARIVVQDDGAGVPDYALERAFERFYSLPRPDHGRKSSGLGLAFVREVAELHGGKASLANRAGGGAVATLTLPAHPRP